MREDILALQSLNVSKTNADKFIEELKHIKKITNPEDARLFQENILKVYPIVKHDFNRMQQREFISEVIRMGQTELATLIAEQDYEMFKCASYEGRILMLKDSLHKEFESGVPNGIISKFFGQYYSMNDLMDYAEVKRRGKAALLVKEFVDDPQISKGYKARISQAEKDYKRNLPNSTKNKLAAAGTVAVSLPGVIVGATGIVVSKGLGLLKKGVDKATYYLAKPTDTLMKKCGKLSLQASTKGKRALAKAGEVALSIPMGIIEGVGTVVGGVIKISEFMVKLSAGIVTLPFMGAGKLILDKARIPHDKRYDYDVMQIKKRIAELLELPNDKKFLNDMFVTVKGNENGIILQGLYNRGTKYFTLDFSDDFGVGKDVESRSKEGITLIKKDKELLTEDFTNCISAVSNIVTHQEPTNEFYPRPFELLV